MKTKMMTINRRGAAMNIPLDERENKRLRELLQKAVRKETAPAGLREKIRQMIRETS
jgi:hypothetical protein